MIIKAPAKINIGLRILNKRDDGYHSIETIFYPVKLYDRLDVEIAPSDSDINSIIIKTEKHTVPISKTNTCFKVIEAFFKNFRIRETYRINIFLEKYIPIGGGLGGGSSDAATVLLALNRLWRLDLPRAELQALGLGLGADVPVFVFGRSAFAQGVGEVLAPWTPSPASYVVLTPPVHVSTPAIFAHPGLTRNTPAVTIAALLDGYGHNDLEPVACALNPELVEHLDWLKQWGDGRMTGSGACVFAAFSDRAEAARVFARRPGSMGGFVADGVDQHPLFGYAD